MSLPWVPNPCDKKVCLIKMWKQGICKYQLMGTKCGQQPVMKHYYFTLTSSPPLPFQSAKKSVYSCREHWPLRRGLASDIYGLVLIGTCAIPYNHTTHTCHVCIAEKTLAETARYRHLIQDDCTLEMRHAHEIWTRS